ncbi:asparagine synthase-related protein [Pelagicoccus mobilis]|uniref:asparagine synthase (glutamine-hydrolyzing) n=1 Tax=Pelagicoccus mobilis TaxID=415221 RepID=A0A934RRP4_9BACT|nr:asparagine synthase-related protein [Pelagicoccus mobilis]MBK1875657.1 hypothetical protein [Pelagicoccus mobilis]
MSDFAGIFNFTPNPALRSNLEAMSLAMREHAFDSRDSWVLKNLGLAHQLLQRSPEDRYERQPLQEPPYTIVGDIRIDNREELAAELGISSLKIPSLPDSRLVLLAYQKWGKNCFSKLVGAFSIAIFDHSKGELVLARDPLGQKPLLYHEGSDFFAFSTLSKALHAHPRIPRKLNEPKLAELLALNHNDHRTTVYDSIHRVPPSHFLKVTNGRIQIEKYYDLATIEPIRCKSDQEYLDLGRSIFEKSVKSALRSDRPIGAMMSGGLDSSSVACVAANLLAQEGVTLPTLTHVPQHPKGDEGTQSQYFDETPLVHQIHKKTKNLRLNFVKSTGRTLFHELDRRQRLIGIPDRNPLNHIWIDQISELAEERGIRVLLGGARGNMTLSYNGIPHLSELAKKGNWIRLATMLRQGAKELPGSPLRLLRNQLLAQYKPIVALHRLLNKDDIRYLGWKGYSALNNKYAQEIDIDTRNERLGFDPRFLPPSDPRAFRIVLLTGPDYFGDFSRVLSGAFKTEIRDPMADLRLVRFCLSIPDEQYIKNGQPRSLIKRMMANVLPKSVLENKRKGLQASDWPERLLMAKPQIEAELALLQKSDTARRILDLDRMKNLVEHWPSGGWYERETTYHYHYLLPRGIVVGRFIRRFEEGKL